MEQLPASAEIDAQEQLTKAFLFTDLVGSTASWQVDAGAMSAALAAHDELLGRVFAAAGGELFKHTGDGLIAKFDTSEAAVEGALEAQTRIRSLDWGAVGRRGMRVAIHVGPAYSRDGDWFGPTLNRTARVLGVIGGDQIVLTASATDQLSEGSVDLVDVGLHRLRDITRPERLYAVRAEGLSVTAPKTTMAKHRRLPRLRTSVVGREQDLSALVEVVSSEQLTTLVGPGGIGKTTLAIAAAGGLAAELDCGAAFAELVELSTPAEVGPAVAAALGVSLDQIADDPAAIADQIARTVAGTPTLLVLDNCEHLIDACAELADLLLEISPDLRLLATSREPLSVPGEVTKRLGPLETGIEGAAVELFMDRLAKAGGPASLDPDQRQAVADLCQALDGLPLAVELAAAQATQIPIAELARRLEQDVSALSTDARGRHERQRTLEAAVAWGYDLLTESERTVIRRLAVFAGTFDIDSAAEVLSFDGLDADQVRRLIPALVKRSFVVADDVWLERPYRVLETVRAFGRKQLDLAGEVEVTRTAHSRYFLGGLARLAEENESEAPFEVAAEMAEIEADVRAAIDYAIATESLEALSAAFSAIAVYAFATGRPREELRTFEALDEWLWTRPAPEHGRILYLHTRVHGALGESPIAFQSMAARAAELPLEGDDTIWEAVVTAAASWRFPRLPEQQEAAIRNSCERMLDWLERNPAERLAADIPTMAACTISIRSSVGDPATAEPAYEEALRITSAISPDVRFGGGLRASLLLRFGHVDEALAYLAAESEHTLTWWDTTATELISVAAQASAGRSEASLTLLKDLYRRAASSGQEVFQRSVATMAGWVAWTEGERELASETLASSVDGSSGFHGGEACLTGYLLGELRSNLDRDTRRAAIRRGAGRTALEATEQVLTRLQPPERAAAVASSAEPGGPAETVAAE